MVGDNGTPTEDQKGILGAHKGGLKVQLRGKGGLRLHLGYPKFFERKEGSGDTHQMLEWKVG